MRLFKVQQPAFYTDKLNCILLQDQAMLYTGRIGCPDITYSSRSILGYQLNRH